MTYARPRQSNASSNVGPVWPGLVSPGYDTPGLGYGETDSDDTSILHRRLSELACDFDVPYIANNAWGMPFPALIREPSVPT